MSVRTTTSLAESTVSDAAAKSREYARRRKAAGGAWNSPVVREQVPPEALSAALAIADGDSTRLWFSDDGEVWILNHTRATTCASAACPPCASRH